MHVLTRKSTGSQTPGQILSTHLRKTSRWRTNIPALVELKFPSCPKSISAPPLLNPCQAHLAALLPGLHQTLG